MDQTYRPSIDLTYTTEPYSHQTDALTKAWSKKAFAFFMEQGTGKSKIIVDEIVNLIERKAITCAVILAPNQVHENWKEQFELHGPPDYDKWYIQVYKSSNNKKKQEQLTRDIIQSGKVIIFLMNIESLSHASGVDYLLRLLRARRANYVAVDESHKIKTPGAMRTRNAIMLGKLAHIKRIATGTEASEGIEDLYAQLRFLDPTGYISGHKTFSSFKGMHCIMGGFEGREILGYQNQQVLSDRIAPHVYSIRKHECLDLPDKVYSVHHIDMTKEQYAMYAALEDELLIELDNGTLLDAPLVITRMMRMQQVLCGHVGANGHGQELPSNRASYIKELVESESGKSIIFCRFIKDVELMQKELIGANINSVAIYGETTNRLEAINSWRSDPNIRCLIMTIATGGTGLTLNESHNTIFYSNDWSLTNRLQAEDRNHRIGQNDKVTYHDIIVKGSIDEKLLKALRRKLNLADAFRDMMRDSGAQAIKQWMRG